MTPSLLVLTPAHRCHPGLALAAARAGAAGILDLAPWMPQVERHAALTQLRRAAALHSSWGVRCQAAPGPGLAMLAQDSNAVGAGAAPSPAGRIPWLVLAGASKNTSAWPELLRQARQLATTVILEVEDAATARQAAAAGVDGVILRALEAGGRVGSASAFLLLQQMRDGIGTPAWLAGAWGAATAAAAVAAGAGIVLSEELWLTRESSLPAAEKERFARLDGSETTLITDADGSLLRLFSHRDRAGLAILEAEASAGRSAGALLQERWLTASAGDEVPLALGQGIAFAASLARRHRSAAGVIHAFHATADKQMQQVLDSPPMAPGSSLARACGLEHPLVQGPMTRVSDNAPFCRAVAEAGALPFLALALMRGDEVRELLASTHELMGERPWGVGILGFVPPELRQEQMAVISERPPRFAIIAGGRPSQAREMEDAGTATFLHVPSPGLLRSFLEQGARRFILEGRECGGHVGPRPSFTLWQSAVDVLLDHLPENPGDLQVLLAGGIHDAFSAALVNVLVAPLAARGVQVGMLMGTAYLFTGEAVATGAITPTYQEEAIACRETVLLASGVGHATRCSRSAFAAEFARRKSELQRAGRTADEIRFEMEMLNVGRLRLASKGLTRAGEKQGNGRRRAAAARLATLEENTTAAAGRADLMARGEALLRAPLVPVSATDQRRQGMYMIGEVATMRDQVLSMAELHQEVSAGGARLAAEMAQVRLAARCEQRPPRRHRRDQPGEPLAIIGMACRFPGAPDVRQYWENIMNGVDAVREVPAERWDARLYYTENRLDTDRLYSRWGSFLEEMRFDPLQYRIPPASMAHIEPVQLMALEVAHAAMEDAGYADRPFPRERTAVIFGFGGIHEGGIGYAMRTLVPRYLEEVPGLDAGTRERVIDGLRHNLPGWTEDSFPGMLVNVISGRVANSLDLKGSNYVVDAACASSLAALQAAAEELRSGACDMALAGAADATNHPFTFMGFARTHALTPSGKVRPFDDGADGIVLGEGIATVVLKRLADAERDGDRVHAVIRGLGSSSDGRNRSLTAPHAASQALAIGRALSDAGVPAASISLVEAHATGTAVGDQSEIAALRQALAPPAGGQLAGGDEAGADDAGTAGCALGSVKSMIGHAKAAAGMAGLIKTVLALEHHVLPPTLNVNTPNRKANLSRGHLYVNSATRPWVAAADQAPRRAGVSAFGFGGTNFHVILEESPAAGQPAIDLAPRAAEVFLWSRPDGDSLAHDVDDLCQRLDGAGTALTGAAGVAGLPLAELALALHSSEQAHRGKAGRGIRLGITASSHAELRQRLDTSLRLLRGEEIKRPTGVHLGSGEPARADQVCFLFPGQGAQRVNMLADLVMGGPLGVESFRQADELLADLMERPLSSFIYPRPAFSREEERQQRDAVTDTRVAQPALGVVNLLAADMLQRFGLSPAFAAGHSYGEYVALAVAGLTSNAELLRLSALRGRAVHDAGRDHPGGMAAVAASAADTQKALEEMGIEAQVANLNGPTQTIIGGSIAAIKRAMEEFPGRNLAIRRIAVTAAFHTPAMEQPSAAIGAYLETMEMALPRIPVYSNVTARPYPADLNAIRQQLKIHLARPVRFVELVENLHDDGARIFLEAGPGRILTGLVQRILAGRPHTAIPMDNPGQPGWLSLGTLLAQTHALGLPLDLDPWFAGRGHREQGVAACLEAAARRARGRPSDWILAPQGARPLAAPVSTAGRHGRRQPSSAAVDSSAFLANPVHDTVREVPTMTDKPEPPQAHPAAAPAAAPPLLTHLQETMNNWLLLQKEQQRLHERFLSLQERIVEQIITGGSPEGRPATAATSVAGSMPRPTAAGIHVPPAPVLPDLRVAPAIPAADPDLARTPTATETGSPPLRPRPTTVRTDGGTGGGNGGLPTVESFQRGLIAEVSQRTGYPEEMLDLDTPLEAGLGIDSIKTMEIFSSLKKFHAVLADPDQDEEELMVRLTQMKTLRDIIDHYAERLTQAALPPPRAGAEDARPFESGERQPVSRYTLQPVAVPLSTDITAAAGSIIFPRDRLLIFLGDAPGLATGLDAALAAGGFRIAHLLPGKPGRRLGTRRYQADLGDAAAVRQALDDIRRDAGGMAVGGLVNLLGLGEPLNRPGLNGLAAPLHLVQGLAQVARVLEADLRAAAGEGGGWLVNITSLDGRFGLKGCQQLPVAQAGSLGFFKSLAREWKQVRVKNIDVDMEAGVDALLLGLLQELAAGTSDLEIGLDSAGRWRIDMVPAPLTAATPVAAGGLEAGTWPVILATGGGLGVTAETLKHLARRQPGTFIIAGRSPQPEEQQIDDTESELRARLLRQMRADDATISLAGVETEVRRRLKARSLAANLAALRATGSQVEYHSVDVRQEQPFSALIDDVYARHGRIDGVLHGAGVIEDRWLRDKTTESLTRVFETKVNGALILARQLRPEKLRFFIMFSSLSARLGNTGQCDYSAANEVLNKLAAHLHREWPGRVVAVNWGPWDGGMLTPGLRDIYRERGIGLIPMEDGARSLLAEIDLGPEGAPEVVLACDPGAAIRLLEQRA